MTEDEAPIFRVEKIEHEAARVAACLTTLLAIAEKIDNPSAHRVARLGLRSLGRLIDLADADPDEVERLMRQQLDEAANAESDPAQNNPPNG